MKSLENHHFKLTMATAVTVVIFLTSMTYSFSSWKSSVESDMDKIMTGLNHVGETYGNFDDRITLIEAQDTLVKIQIATMEARLTNIEALLLELKIDVKKLLIK